jgi:hypothetical protein
VTALNRVLRVTVQAQCCVAEPGRGAGGRVLPLAEISREDLVKVRNAGTQGAFEGTSLVTDGGAATSASGVRCNEGILWLFACFARWRAGRRAARVQHVDRVIDKGLSAVE